VSDESRRLEARLRPAFDEDQIATTWERIGDARGKRVRRRRQLRFAAIPVLTLGAAVAVMLVLRDPSDDRPPLAAAGAVIEPGTELATAVAFDDGSRIALAPEAKLQVLANDGRRFSTKLVRGAADFTVRPGGPRTWEIETALATVEVVGTAFRVAHADRSVTVTVSHGIVLVRGERVRGRVQRLTAGEQLVVTDDRIAEERGGATPRPVDPPSEARTTETPSDDPARTADRDRDRQPSTGTVDRDRQPSTATVDRDRPTVAVERDRDRDRSRERERERERERAGADQPAVRPSTPTTPSTRSKQSIADVLSEADKLGPQAAATLIERALANHPHDSSAGVAAFVLGKLYLDSLDQPAKAATLFRSIANRGSPHGLVEDSRARLVEALVKAGNAAAAREAFAEYERRHPNGRWRPTLRKLVPAP
jgi:TolA-binding protein